MTATEHGFKAEVQQLLDLMIHSVYSDREVFLRELVSNAADALDKVRFLELTRHDLTGAATEESGIRVEVDEEKGTITIDDDGVGMTEAEVVENLGTIARSGTKAFLDTVKEGGSEAPNLIGQFGLGFYASFMVADEVEVETRSAEPDSAAVVWTSKGKGTYEVTAGTRENRGTRITLILREDATEFSEQGKIGSIIRKHSNYLPWPIHLGEEKANAGRAIWVEPASTISDEDANAFYKTVGLDWRDPALRVHVSVDSPIQYHAMLFVPSARPYDLFYPDMVKGPRLYARRVLIDEHAKDLLPDWLRFVRGVVDSEDIRLNVSREMVQKTPVLRKIRSALTKRILKELKRLAAREADPVEEAEPVEVAEGEEAPIEAAKPANFSEVWRNFGALLKEGYYHDRDSFGEQLLPLLRFNTLNHEDAEGLRSLADYKAEMAEGQDAIWYLTGETREAALASPHLEAIRKRGWDVLLLTETVDEWLMQVLETYEEIPVKSVARGDLEIEEDEEAAEEKADLTEFTPWMQEVLGDIVSAVRPSARLTESACVLVDEDQGMSGNMERILRSANQDVVGGAKRVLEVNPRHPLIKNLASLHSSGRTGDAEPIARLLLDDAMLLEGSVKDAAAVGRRLQDLLTMAARSAVEAGAES
jgi:molecular chaperone HtpG